MIAALLPTSVTVAFIVLCLLVALVAVAAIIYEVIREVRRRWWTL